MKRLKFERMQNPHLFSLKPTLPEKYAFDSEYAGIQVLTPPDYLNHHVKIDFSPKPPTTPTDLTSNGKIVYDIIRSNQEFGGVTAKKIRAVMNNSKDVKEDITLQDVGDILYGELKTRNLCYKVGERGGKWRIIV